MYLPQSLLAVHHRLGKHGIVQVASRDVAHTVRVARDCDLAVQPRQRQAGGTIDLGYKGIVDPKEMVASEPLTLAFE